LEDLDNDKWTDELAEASGEAMWQALEALWDHGVERFNFLTNWGEQFDGFKSYIVRPPTSGTVLIVSKRLPTVVSAVSIDGLRTASQGFMDWFDQRAAELA
jgi:hypothetical protein